MPLTWSKHLSIGNEMIDSDHKIMFVVINSMMHAIKSRDRAALSKSYKLLDTYLGIHFRHEEIIAEAIKFPFEQNRIEQRQLLSEMSYMMNILEDMYRAWPDNVDKIYSGFLNGWMTNHIIRTDMQMKPALEAYPYNFKPA